LTGGTPAEAVVRFEMACTPADFHRLLPAVAPVEYDAALNQFVHTEGSRRWSLRLIDLRERKVAALRLPMVDVVLVFDGYSQTDIIDAVVQRFFAHFHRGGG
jgi:hypothetical protein